MGPATMAHVSSPTPPPHAPRPSEADTPAQGSVSAYLKGSVANMLRTLLVIGALMALVIIILPRTSSVSRPPVDVHAAAIEVQQTTGWPISEPGELPTGWAPTQVRYLRSTDDLMVWHAGFETDDHLYVALEQTMDATDTWVTAQTNRAPSVGTLEAAGLTWEKFDRDTKVQRSLVHRGGPGELTTLITGTGTFEQLVTFAKTLEPVTR